MQHVKKVLNAAESFVPLFHNNKLCYFIAYMELLTHGRCSSVFENIHISGSPSLDAFAPASPNIVNIWFISLVVLQKRTRQHLKEQLNRDQERASSQR